MDYDWQTRYARQISLPQVGVVGQKKLAESSVLVIGAGGLGAPLLLYLAAAGVGKIGIIDPDRVALSNLPRQILYETADIGRLKVEAARDVLEERNPEVVLEMYPYRAIYRHPAGRIASAQDIVGVRSCALASGKPQDDTVINIQEIIQNYDIIADGSDNFATRLAVNAACHDAGKTLVSAAVIGFEGQISTYKSHLGAPHPCYQCWVGNETPEDVACSAAGVLGSAAGVVASLQATEIIKELLDIGESLSGKILRYDALDARWQYTQLQRDPVCRICSYHTDD